LTCPGLSYQLPEHTTRAALGYAEPIPDSRDEPVSDVSRSGLLEYRVVEDLFDLGLTKRPDDLLRRVTFPAHRLVAFVPDPSILRGSI